MEEAPSRTRDGVFSFSAASASVDIHLAARIGTDGRTPMCRPMAPPSRPAAAVRVRLRAAERGLERGRSSFAVGRASRSVYENKIDLLTGVINALSRVFHRPECGWIDSALSHTSSCPPVLSESALPGTCSLPALSCRASPLSKAPVLARRDLALLQLTGDLAPLQLKLKAV